MSRYCLGLDVLSKRRPLLPSQFTLDVIEAAVFRDVLGIVQHFRESYKYALQVQL